MNYLQSYWNRLSSEIINFLLHPGTLPVLEVFGRNGSIIDKIWLEYYLMGWK